MRYDGQYVNVKRMALALDGLIRREYPGDYLQFIEMYTFAKPVQPGEIATLMPKPVTIFDPFVRLRGRHEPRGHERVLRCRRTSRTSSTRCNWPGSSWRRRTRPTGRSS